MAKPRRVKRWLAGGGAVLLIAVAASSCVGPPWYYMDKYQPAGDAWPRAMPEAIRPERQIEPHTCGLCCLTSVYRAYGLDPAARRVRYRSGVDKPVINFMPSTRGTIHPDMLRVLRQDGFAAEAMNLKHDAGRVADHLDRGHFAIALVRVNELHWVVLCGRRGENVVICDSLREELYEEPMAEYLRDRVYSLVLVEPEPSGG
ncbi:MAG: cysteine peptidase family C39 domain-containing protein [Phycisphaerales bacterium]